MDFSTVVRHQPASMEAWQRQGFSSFGEYRRVTEKRRRDAKKAAAVTPTRSAAVQPASSTATQPAFDVEDGTIQLFWQPLQIIEPPPPHPTQHDGWSAARKNQSSHYTLHDLHEHVQVTPCGSRAHSLQHKSPRFGTTRFASWISPPGVRKSTRANAGPGFVQAHQRLVSSMKETLARCDQEECARIEQERCGTCKVCIAVALGKTGTGFGVSRCAPCETATVMREESALRRVLKLSAQPAQVAKLRRI